MLTGIYGHTEVRAPQFDVLLLDGSLQTRSVFEHVRDNPADVIAVHAESILEADSDGALRELIPALLARSATPLLLLNSKLVWRGGGSGARTIQSTAA